MASKKREVCTTFDDGRHASDLRSPDEEVRGDAVRSLCPCHAGWEVFESHVGEVLGAFKDPSRGVRAHALHVFDDAARMRHAEEREYYVQAAEEVLTRKRASRFRPEEGGLEARHKTKLRWRAGRR
ncbi:MAG TPA: hypothetical protein VF659_07235 [Pyrinomonadaceae bacterium]|jgi:hypothetical protein